MIKLSKVVRVVLLLLINSRLLYSQDAGTLERVDSVGEFSLQGSIDSYFHKSFDDAALAPRTSFANLPGFSLGMVNVIGAFDSPKSGFLADLVLGPRGSDAVFHAPHYKNTAGGGSAHIINQMYAYFRISPKFKLNIGQFNTFIGYETISPVKNFHYSTSYLFSYGPFNHTGMWTDIKLTKRWSAKMAVMNATDYTEFNPFDSFTLGGQLAFTGKKRIAFFNATYGDPDGRLSKADSIGSTSLGNVLQLDFTGSWTFFEKYDIGLGTSVRTSKTGEIKISTSENSRVEKHGFYGFTLYNKFSLSEWLSLGFPDEYFEESNGGVGAIGVYSNTGNAWVYDFTFSANMTAGNFKFIPEMRLDKTSSYSFINDTSGRTANKLTTINLAVIYSLPKLSHIVATSKSH